jgi:hypothetical protein
VERLFSCHLDAGVRPLPSLARNLPSVQPRAGKSGHVAGDGSVCVVEDATSGTWWPDAKPSR